MVKVSPFQEELRTHLETSLPKVCQVEPAPLAKYIVTLLERDQELELLQESCNEKLSEFLHSETKSFVEDLFTFLRARMAEQKQTHIGEDDDDDDHTKRRRGASPERSRVDDEGPRRRHRDSRERERRRYRESPRRDRRDDDDEEDRRRRRVDRGDRFRNPAPRRRTRERCRDFDAGRCTRGASCMHEHVPRDVPMPLYGDTRDPPYDPEHATLGFPVRDVQPLDTSIPHATGGPSPRPELLPFAPASFRIDAPRYPNDFQLRPSPQQTFAQPPFAHGAGVSGREAGFDRRLRPSERQRLDRQAYYSRLEVERPTNIVLINVPKEKNNITELGAWLGKFGEVVSLRVFPSINKAYVKFRQHEQARVAVHSPEPLFNNRHIQVKWAREDPNSDDKKADAADSSSTPTTGSSSQSVNQEVLPAPVGSVSVPGAARPPRGKKMSMVFHSSALTPAQVSELNAAKQKLLSQQIQQQKELLAKLSSSKTLSPQDRADLMAKISGITKQVDGVLHKNKAAAAPVAPAASAVFAKPQPSRQQEQRAALDRELDELQNVASSGEEALKAKLAQVEQEALAMGLLDAQGNPVVRGHGRGRGRGRGGPSRMVRVGGRSLTLDKRTATLSVQLPPGVAGADGALLAHFQQFGKAEVLSSSDQHVVVKFAARHEAEAAMSRGREFQGAKLVPSWLEAPVAAAAVAASAGVEGGAHRDSEDEQEEEQEEENERRRRRI